MKRMLLFILLMVLPGYMCVFLHGKNDGVNHSVNTDSYRVPRVENLVRVDGRLDEKIWENALKIELKYEVEPGENVPARVHTICMLSYGTSHLYIAFKAFDPNPGELRAFLNDRDAGTSDDWVGIVLDTFHDKRRAFDFRCSPLGIQSDGIKVDNVTDFSWDAIWNSAGKIYHWGYAVEISIPFKALRFRPSETAQIWGFDAVRYYPRNHQFYFGTFPRDRSNNSYLSQALQIKGFKNVFPGRNLEIMPTITAVRTDQRESFPDGGFERKNSDVEAGVTARLGLTSQMILNATLNPDFSQVEADALQLDINQPFALYYKEKRPFFTEGADFFKPRMTDFMGTSNNMIYTRSIRDPSWGFKLTGKGGHNTYGAFILRDEMTNIIFPGNQGSKTASLSTASMSSAFRFRHDIGTRHTIGILATDRESSDYFNRLIGLDGDFRVTDKDLLQFQFFGSSTRYPEGLGGDYGQDNTVLTGTALDLNYRHSTRTLNYYGRFQRFSRDFRADLGYIPRVDYSRYRIGGSYTWNAKPDNWYSKIKLCSEMDTIVDLQGDVINGGIYVWGTFYGPLQSMFQAVLGKTRQKYSTEEFNQTTLYMMGSIQVSKHFFLSLEGNFGDHIDYDNVQEARRISLFPSIEYNIGRHLSLSFSLKHERLNVEKGELYTANMADTSISYQLSRRIYLRAVIQFVDYKYNVENYVVEVAPRFRDLFAQIRFSYKLNPRTVVFLGYSNHYQGMPNFHLRDKDHTFFAKIGYALQI